MNDIIIKIQNNIERLNYRLNQCYYSDKKIKFYYHEKIRNIKTNILDLKAQLIYESNKNDSKIIDLHGANSYFIDYYFDDLLYFKSDIYKDIILITGRGSGILYNYTNKHLEKNGYRYKKINNSKFFIFL